MKRPCVYTDTDNHSADVLAVYHGAPEPTFICGYHEASRGVPSKWALTLSRIDRFCGWCGFEHGSSPEENAACLHPRTDSRVGRS